MMIYIKLVLCLVFLPLHAVSMLRFQNDHCVVVGDFPTSLITVKDLATGLVINLDAVKMPIAMVEKDNFLYILGFQSFTVAVVDLTNYKVIRTYTTDKAPVELTLSDTHVLVNRMEHFPLFPIKRQFQVMLQSGRIDHYFRDYMFLLDTPVLAKQALNAGEFKELIANLKGAARLVKEQTLDYLSPEESLMVIILLDEQTYLNSGEWKFRRKMILNRICIRLTLLDRLGARHLVQLMKTMGDPLLEFGGSNKATPPSTGQVSSQGVDDDGDQPNG